MSRGEEEIGVNLGVSQVFGVQANMEVMRGGSDGHPQNDLIVCPISTDDVIEKLKTEQSWTAR